MKCTGYKGINQEPRPSLMGVAQNYFLNLLATAE